MDNPTQNGLDVEVRNSNIRALRELQRVNDERYDATLTTLSAAFLGISISFISELVPLAEAICIVALSASWVFFALTTICTLLSYFTSNKAINWQVQHIISNEWYAVDVAKANPWDRRTRCLNVSAGFFFMLGIVCTLWFSIANIHHQQKEGRTMSNRTTQPSQSETERRGMTMPPMETSRPQQGNQGSGGTAPQQKPPASNTGSQTP